MVCHAAFASARLPLKCLGLVRNHTGGYNVSADHDLAIRWNDDISSVRHLRHTGSVPIWAFPRSFRCPGGVVAIISQNNDIRLMFRATAIHGPQRVKLANGKSRLNGDVIKFDKRAMREPRPLIRAPFRGWYAVGAFRYFNAAKMRPILVGDSVRSSGDYIEDFLGKSSGVIFRPHLEGIPGLSRGHPEATLVDQYVTWMGERNRFGHNYIRDAGLFVDLFDLTHWQLLEAKATASREAIRMAIGQLRDYRRYYPRRRPSLAVLVSSRPSANCIKLLTDNRIAAVWRTAGGKFSSRRWQA